MNRAQFRARHPLSTMKYICLGYIDPKLLPSFAQPEMHAMVDSCLTYDDQLRANGHYKGGEALQPPNTAMTLRYTNGKVVVTDGPFAETKEQIGGLAIIKADSKQHAIELVQHFLGVAGDGECELRQLYEAGQVAQSAGR
jgi:hypothetical protein